MIVDLTVHVSREQMEQWLGQTEQRLIAAGHIGTHLDTYKKTPIPLTYFKSKGVLIDTAAFCEEREITVGDVVNAGIAPNSFVLFRTGRSERFQYGSDAYFENHPQLSGELIDWLCGQGIRFIGIDCSGIRRGEEHTPADKRCEDNGIYVIENLCNLDSIVSSEFTVYTMWLDDSEMTGLKCRVIAELE